MLRFISIRKKLYKEDLDNLSRNQLINEIRNLQKSEKRLQSFVVNLSEALFCYEYVPPISIDLPIKNQIEMFYNGILVDCNVIGAQYYGYTKISEVLGKSLTELFKAPQGSLDEFFKDFIVNEYKVKNAEASEILEDGSKRYFLNNAHSTIENGLLKRVWGAYREITDIKETEEEIEMRKICDVLNEINTRLTNLEKQPRHNRVMLNDGFNIVELESTGITMLTLLDKAIIVKDGMVQKMRKLPPKYIG